MKITLSLLSCLFAVSLASAATSIVFENGDAFDKPGDGGNGGIGAFETYTDGGQSFDLTTVDVIGSNGLSNLNDGAANLTSVASRGFGIATPGDSESTSFNGGEAWVASFSKTVVFESISADRYYAGASLSLIFGDGPTIALSRGTNPIGVTLDAGKSFTIQASSDSANCNFESITVSVPETSSYAAVLGLGVLGLVGLRRRFR